MILSIGLIILFIGLAVVNLITGLTNDAVNFLNSAIGSKITSRKVIFWVASVGLVGGSLFASDMMDIARSGVVFPDQFSFRDMMAVCLAVVIANIILIDLCNTFGLPTSTTTAMILELTGGALAISLIKSGFSGIASLNQLVDVNHVFVIMAGIFISVLLAFFIAIGVQFFTRLIFTFKENKSNGILFSLTGAFAITLIAYFILKKGIHSDWMEWTWLSTITDQFDYILISVFALVWFVLLLGVVFFHLNVPRIVVVMGTFGLALSFAANDLVNFIGVPLTGIENIRMNLNLSGDNLVVLRGFDTSGWVYIFAFFCSGLILAVTLFRSHKVKAVIETEVFLGRQFQGYEKFEPSFLSRSIVRHYLRMFQKVCNALPLKFRQFVSDRYEQKESPAWVNDSYETEHFDAVRASVNLVLATGLILLGTWFEIPVSTTFIVFMVSMGTSMADHAWRRENAMYRLSGMLTILGTWFFTSCLAILGAFVLTLVIWYGGVVAVICLLLAMSWGLHRSTRYFRQSYEEKKLRDRSVRNFTESGLTWMKRQGDDQFVRYLLEASKIYFLSVNGFLKEDVDQTRLATRRASELLRLARQSREDLFTNLVRIPEQSLESGQHFIQALDYANEFAGALQHLSEALCIHLESQNKGLNEEQRRELADFMEQWMAFLNFLVYIEKEQRFDQIEEVVQNQKSLIDLAGRLTRNQISRMRKGESKTKVSVMVIEMIGESKNMLLFVVNMIKSHRDFELTSRFKNG